MKTIEATIVTHLDDGSTTSEPTRLHVIESAEELEALFALVGSESEDQ